MVWRALWLLPLLLAGAAAGDFAPDGLQGWEAQRFGGRAPTQYRLVDDGADTVLQADCDAAASGLIRRQRVDLTRTPVLSWRWRTQAVFAGLDERVKAGDDFPLRVYVVRDGGWARWRTRALVYVWSSGATAARDWPNPYSANAHVVALRHGAARVGDWVEEARDVRADFATYFGIDADRVDAVAVMSDCDDSGRAVRAWYDALRWHAR